MAEALFVVTGFVIAVSALLAYQRTRDPLCAMVIFSPMLLYFYTYHPIVMLNNPEVLRLTGATDSSFATTAIVNLLGVTAFCLGCTRAKRSRRREQDSMADIAERFSDKGRRQVNAIALLLGLVAVSVFWFLVWNSGGFVQVFMSGGKPFLRGAGSGYIGELPMLSFPAMLLIAVARQGRKFRFVDYLSFLFVASPQIIWATLGGRRGPMFLMAMTVAASWVIVRSKRPKLAGVLSGLIAVGLLIVFLAATRQSLFLGSDKEFSFTDFTQELTAGTETIYGDEFICGYAVIETSERFQQHYWGHRFLVQLFVRPIPRQLWPTKYVDTGLEWMDKRAGTSGFAQSEFLQTVGFEPTGGSSTGFVADLFLEFSWGGVLGCFIVGWFYSYLWNKSHRKAGFWNVLYYIALILSVYLVAQSVISAWGYRMILLGLPTWLIWTKIVDPRMRRRHQFLGDEASPSSTFGAGVEPRSVIAKTQTDPVV
jgi:oligosaccharide repeat unit polymerase